MQLGDRLKEYRKNHSMSQEELAKKMNVTRQTVSAWENNKAMPSVSTIMMLANEYHVSVEELCGLETIKEDTESAPQTSRFCDKLFGLKHEVVEMILYLIMMVTTCYFLYFGVLFDAYVLIFYKCENKKIQFWLKIAAVIGLGVSIYLIVFSFLAVFGTEGTTTIEKL